MGPTFDRSKGVGKALERLQSLTKAEQLGILAGRAQGLSYGAVAIAFNTTRAAVKRVEKRASADS